MSSAARLDLGPSLPSRGSVHARARELLVLAQRAVEFSTPGPRCDLVLAQRQFDTIRGLVGEAGDA